MQADGEIIERKIWSQQYFSNSRQISDLLIASSLSRGKNTILQATQTNLYLHMHRMDNR